MAIEAREAMWARMRGSGMPRPPSERGWKTRRVMAVLDGASAMAVRGMRRVEARAVRKEAREVAASEGRVGSVGAVTEGGGEKIGEIQGCH